MSIIAQPLPLVDVHFPWSHSNTVSLSSDTIFYGQYSQYMLKIILLLFFTQSVH